MNANIKNILIDVLSSRPVAPIGQFVLGQGVPIFMLHRVQDSNTPDSATSVEHLRRCLQYLVENKFTFLSLHDLVLALTSHQSLPKKSIVFTVDDGFEDQVKVAAPIFLEFDCPVTIFLITGLLDDKEWPWDDKVAYLIKTCSTDFIDITICDENYQLPLGSERAKRQAREIIRNAIKAAPSKDLDKYLMRLESATGSSIPASAPPEYKAMTWDLAREYEQKGVEFAPHTMTHRILSKLDTGSMQQEILGSWQRVRDELATPKPVFGYPTGRYCDFGSREVKFLRESGFAGAVSTIPAQVRQKLVNDYYLYGLPRYSLPDNFHDFKMYCGWIEYAKERNLRLWPR
jgi:peptidoglycan/xylan/chitin deacetylase (PgdA/CDA1 family)